MLAVITIAYIKRDTGFNASVLYFCCPLEKTVNTTSISSVIKIPGVISVIAFESLRTCHIYNPDTDSRDSPTHRFHTHKKKSGTRTERTCPFEFITNLRNLLTLNLC